MTYQDIINLGLKKGISEIELYAKTSTDKTLKVFNGSLESYNAKELYSLSIRGLYNGKMGYASCESLNENVINEALDKLITSCGLLTSTEVEEIFGEKVEYEKLEEVFSDATLYPLSEKIELLKSLEQETLASDERIKKIGYCQYVETEGKVEIINSKGINLHRNFSYIVVVLGALGMENGQTNVGYVHQIETSFKNINKEKLIKDVVEKTVSGLCAGSVKTGEYPVVLEQEVATDLIQAFSSLFSGYAAMKNMTMLNGKKGEKVFGDNITLIDDPFCETSLIKVAFDDEAYPCKKRNVVENGVFTGFYHSLKTAKFFNEAPTGNGFRSGNQIIPSPTNLYMLPGEYSKEQLFEGISEGVLITEVGGLHAGLNVVAGTFNIQSSGYMIRDGKKAEPVTLFVVSGNFFDMLNNVEKIGNDLPEKINDVAIPSLLVKGLMISGK
ncbi:MAG: TldD/PmbA family protein [Erysipelotrichaceae bacterium]|nr:TldD/PmbA family protein [Erysipelotrichaceae bacterium]